jgi:fructuronate reductase
MLARGLDVVRRRGGAPPVILSCDNVTANGTTLRGAVVDFAALCDDRLAGWIAAAVRFPCTVADRIVAPTGTTDLQVAWRHLGGVEDRVPVSAEPFLDWTIEDFDGARPRWERAGARFVSDVTQRQLAKLRLLNGTHMLLAYLGALRGHATVAEACGDPLLAALSRQFMMAEQGPTLMLPVTELHRIADELMRRFGNSAIRHDLARVGRNGSDKMTSRVTDAMRQNLAHGRPTPASILLIAGWIRLLGADIDPATALVDPRRDELASIARIFADRPQQLASAFLDRSDIFGTFADRASVQRELSRALADTAHGDVAGAVRRRLAPESGRVLP